MHDAWSMWSCVSKCPVHGRRQMQKKNPRKFQSETMTDVNIYPIYRRRDTGHTVLVHGIKLDNRWVVPHNVYLSTKYNAHISTTTGGYFAIRISSQTTKKEVSKSLLLRTIIPRKLLSFCDTITFVPVQSQVLRNSRT